jgi:YD repeat-containing protein
MDSEFRVTEQTLSGDGVVRQWTFKRDGLGRTIEATDPDGGLAQTGYNLAGWIERSDQDWRSRKRDANCVFLRGEWNGKPRATSVRIGH